MEVLGDTKTVATVPHLFIRAASALSLTTWLGKLILSSIEGGHGWVPAKTFQIVFAIQKDSKSYSVSIVHWWIQFWILNSYSWSWSARTVICAPPKSFTFLAIWGVVSDQAPLGELALACLFISPSVNGYKPLQQLPCATHEAKPKGNKSLPRAQRNF